VLWKSVEGRAKNLVRVDWDAGSQMLRARFPFDFPLALVWSRSGQALGPAGESAGLRMTPHRSG
jgi:hypothetical protein